jgi:hypothetical protein
MIHGQKNIKIERVYTYYSRNPVKLNDLICLSTDAYCYELSLLKIPSRHVLFFNRVIFKGNEFHFIGYYLMQFFKYNLQVVYTEEIRPAFYAWKDWCQCLQLLFKIKKLLLHSAQSTFWFQITSL